MALITALIHPFVLASLRSLETIADMKTTQLILLVTLFYARAVFAVDPPPDGGYPNQNTAEGDSALLALTDGTDDTAVGYHALSANTTGNANTGVGSNVLTSNTTGGGNTGAGFYALSLNTTGGGNTAFGANALQNNTTGNSNTATGVGTLYQNTTGYANTAMGLGALENNTTGFANTSVGVNSMFFNVTGSYNTAVGDQALDSNSSGIGNVAFGISALCFNSSGSQNTAVGSNALQKNSKGSGNIAIGHLAGSNCTASDNIMIGNVGVRHDSGVIRIGSLGVQTNSFLAGVSGVTIAAGVPVVIDNKGHLGTSTSSARYKEEMCPMRDASAAILSLNPVTFRYKKELDPEGIPQFGLVAEEVAKVDPDLVARDEGGRPYTVRYEAVNAMLLNEFLKAHGKMEAQEKEITELRAALKEQAALIQKVSARLETIVPPARLVGNQ
jgi:hypothetical protein